MVYINECTDVNIALKMPSNLWVVCIGSNNFQGISYAGKPQVVSSYSLKSFANACSTLYTVQIFQKVNSLVKLDVYGLLWHYSVKTPESWGCSVSSNGKDWLTKNKKRQKKFRQKMRPWDNVNKTLLNGKNKLECLPLTRTFCQVWHLCVSQERHCRCERISWSVCH